MPMIVEDDLLRDDRIQGDREIIRTFLEEISHEVGIRLQEAGLSLPVYLTVPSSGKAIMILATP